MPRETEAPEQPVFVLSPTELGARFIPANLRSEALPCMAFYRDHVLVVGTLSDYYNVVQHELPLHAIGHVELLRPDRIEVVYGFVTRSSPGRQVFRVSRLVAEDRFDQVVEHLHRAGHLFSWCDEGGVHYPRPWTFADVRRSADPVSRVELTVRSRQPVDFSLATDHGSWTVVFDAGLIARPAEGTEAERDRGAVQLHQGRFSAPSGLLLGGLSPFGGGAFRLVAGQGAGVVVHPGHRLVTERGRRIGVIRGQGAVTFEFDTPVPELLGVMLALAWGRPEEGTRPYPVPDPDEDHLVVRASGAARRFWGGMLVFWVLFAVVQFLRDDDQAWVGVAAGFTTVAMLFERRRDALLCTGLGVELPEGATGDKVWISHFGVGHIEWARRSRLTVRHASHDLFPAATTLANRVAHRDVEALYSALRRFAPDHVHSFDMGDGRIRYSRDFGFDELFPWQRHARRAELLRDSNRLIRAWTAHHAYVVWGGLGYTLTLPEDPDATAVGQPVLHLNDGEILLHNGMIVGRYAADGGISIAAVGQVRVDLATGGVTLGGEPLGVLRHSTGGLALEAEQEVGEVLLLLILLAFAELR